MRNRLFFVDASKVEKYHITLIEGFISAIISSEAIVRRFDIFVWLAESLRANLSERVRSQIAWRKIPVINQDLHHVVRKSLVEFWVVIRLLFMLRRGDVAVVSCLMPTALLLLEILNKVVRKKGIYVVVHGEIDALVEGRIEHWRSIGYWSTLWMKFRSCGSYINIVVIDDFIRSGLVVRSGGKIRLDQISVVHHPVSAMPELRLADKLRPSVCFVGFRTRAKGFDEFVHLGRTHNGAYDFLAVGQGRIENVVTGATQPLNGTSGFLEAIAVSSAAIFPYTSGYCATLSAAALDTLSAGVHIIATDRPFFVSLAEYFGPDFVTIYRSQTELEALLSQSKWLAERQAGQPRRLSALEKSKYSLSFVQIELEQLVLNPK